MGKDTRNMIRRLRTNHRTELEKSMDNDAILWAFQHFYHMDKANACMHCSPVRFSPITFRLLDSLITDWAEDQDITQEMAEVKFHINQYPMDRGRIDDPI
jgi:hypothetical protein